MIRQHCPAAGAGRASWAPHGCASGGDRCLPQFLGATCWGLGGRRDPAGAACPSSGHRAGRHTGGSGGGGGSVFQFAAMSASNSALIHAASIPRSSSSSDPTVWTSSQGAVSVTGITSSAMAARQRLRFGQALMTFWSSAAFTEIFRGLAFSATGSSNLNTPPW